MTKYVALATVALSAALTTGCSELVSLNEFVSAEESVMDRSLLGVWTSVDNTFAITADGNFYTVRYFNKDSTAAKFQARMVNAGDAKLLDVIQETDEAFSVPVHMLVRVSIDGSSLNWSFVDSDAMKDAAARRFAIHKDGKRSIILASGDEWRRTMWKLAAEDNGGNGETLTRVP